MSAVMKPLDTKVDIEELTKHLGRIKINMILDKNNAFITTVNMSLAQEFQTEGCPTAFIDGKRIVYNPEFMMNMDPNLPLLPEHQLFVMLHETWHAAFMHVGTMKGKRFQDVKDRDRLNAAMDYVINNMLDTAGIAMPDWVCMDHKYDNMTTEEVYDALPEIVPQNLMGNDVQPGDGDTEIDEAQMNQILIRAKMAAEMAGANPGSIPAEVSVAINSLTNTKISWSTELRRWFTAKRKTGFTFRKRNRRFPDHIMPTAWSESLGDVSMAVDMSGSVSDEETAVFVSNVYHVLKSVRPTNLDLIQFDTKVFAHDRIKTVQELNAINFTGRGGTRIDPPLKWAEEHKPQVMVIFTDGQFYAPQVNPNIPIIWVIYDNKNFTAPFGKVIHYPLH